MARTHHHPTKLIRRSRSKYSRGKEDFIQAGQKPRLNNKITTSIHLGKTGLLLELTSGFQVKQKY